MKIKSVLTLTLAAALGQVAFAQTKPPEAMALAASAPGKAVVVGTVRVTAMVVQLDRATRTVQLKGNDGSVVDILVPPEAKKFDQVNVGDLVTVEYAKALSLELKKTGSGVRGTSSQSASAPPRAGAVAGGAVGHQVTVMANIVAINAKTGTVTLKGPKGNTMELAVPDPGQLKLAKVGDQVEAVYVEAVAISVEPAAKAPAKK